jgi:hypothetical protein
MVAGAVAASIAVGNTGHSTATPVDTSAKAWVAPQRTAVSLSVADRRAVFRTSLAFIRTAVVRKHLDSAWKLLGPEMRAGQTQASFVSGNNNVVPFPAVGIATWDVLYSYRNDVALDFALVGPKKSEWAGKTFTIELKRSHSTPRQWLVAAWAPRGVGGAGQIRDYQKLFPPATLRSPLDARWLLAPAAVIVAMLLALIGWGVRSKFRYRRAVRRYEELLGHGRGTRPAA